WLSLETMECAPLEVSRSNPSPGVTSCVGPVHVLNGPRTSGQ
ncbi:hypothetical protein A2U01_0079421, partial [Trifolium medium]|nr:hypothetical protein [Trifolium medium]